MTRSAIFDKTSDKIRVIVMPCQDAYVVRHEDHFHKPAKETRWVLYEGAYEGAYDDAEGEALKLAEQLIDPQPVRYCQVITENGMLPIQFIDKANWIECETALVN